ncbi:S9 family peptidase [Steroidobacter sp.]|uniref:S9 family peptidase n=1 Tax=Steroidobacter sp. TaxID=1978227 RepID=UPI001A3B6867|nr:DPP IV N-terminal domain-containing protein [Steroidobacter sp.]MBL8270641.1 DPP IV N-terminal domain-containing protein [Steroidobacter sp.]
MHASLGNVRQLAAGVTLAVVTVLTANASDMRGAELSAAYERAAQFQSARTLVSRETLQPNWIAQGNDFWYLDKYAGNKTFMRVDSARNRQAPAFDHSRLAAGLSSAAGKPFTANDLPFGYFEYRDAGRQIAFQVEQIAWSCELAKYSCTRTVGTPGTREGEVLSPDGRWAVFKKENNLWLRDTSNDAERALTTDGTNDQPYGSDVGEPVTEAMLQQRVEPEAVFSPDSKKLLSYRSDQRRVREIAVIESVPGRPPVTHPYHFPNAGDADVSQVQMIVADVATGRVTPLHSVFSRPASYDTTLCWSENSRQACFSENERGYRVARLHVADVTSGQVSTPVVESSETYVNRNSIARIAGEALIWSSERDGWNHLYRIDAKSGRVQRQLTSGDWAVREILHVDAAQGWVYFTAGGREPGRDPYYRPLYRVRLDGKGLTLLTPDDADHTVSFSPRGEYFVDTYSRLDAEPISVLRRADGRQVRELQRADISKLQAIGWKPPKTFTVKARDGQTDLYGAIFYPSNFDPKRQYPVLDAIYPGPQSINTQKIFSAQASEDEQALAELGFIVVSIDGLGTPYRSKAFRDVSYRNMGAAGGLEDHVIGLKQLATTHPYLDLTRVGIYGHSGGGFASTRALLSFPDFYKVAVASAGNHDQRSYWAEWGERFHAWPVNDDTYLSQANPPLAANLKGKLLLVHGDMDDNVHVTHTLQMVDALIAANRDFDMLILPNRNHGFVDLRKGKEAVKRVDPYFLRRRWDYFVQHLLGTTPPPNFQLQLQD